jgi:hypothetical protein
LLDRRRSPAFWARALHWRYARIPLKAEKGSRPSCENHPRKMPRQKSQNRGARRHVRGHALVTLPESH